MRSTNYLNKMALTALLMASVQATAQTTSFVPAGGSCMSQGSWTQKALEQTDVIARTLEAMQKDPDCKGIANAIGNVNFWGGEKRNQGSLSGDSSMADTYKAETIMRELSALRDVLFQKRNTEAAQQLSPVLASATVDTIEALATEDVNSARNKDLRTLRLRTKNAAEQGVKILGNLFQVMPQHETCMQKRPDLAATLMLGGVKVASAFAMGDMGMSMEMAQLASNFLTYLGEAKYASLKKSLNEQRMWTEISCLMESTQASYCAVQDGFDLLKIQKNLTTSNFVNSPLEGFALMTREVPTVTAWVDLLKTKLNIRADSRTSYLEEVISQLVLVDQYNFVDESVVGKSDSVRAALVSIRSYLSRLYGRLAASPSSQPTLISILDTVSRIDRILGKFKELDKSAKALGVAIERGQIGDLSQLSEQVQAEQLQKITELITTLIKDFQVTTLESSFLSARFSTYVRHEYDVRLEKEDFSKYSSQLLVSARGTVEEKLKEYQKYNIANVQTDLAEASRINMKNLDDLETLVANHYASYLVYLNNRSGNRYRCDEDSGLSVITGIGETIFRPACSGWFASKQDRNGESEILRGKVCLQTLGFKDYIRFHDLCRGSVLKSSQATNGRSIKGLALEFKYDDYFKKRRDAESFGAKYLGLPSNQRYSQVCLVRDYFRNNFVHWLTIKFQQKK